MDKGEFYRDARTDLSGPLHGVRVLDVTTVWSGPMATCLLADLGAEVIRIEMPNNRAGRVPPNIPDTGLSWFDQTVNRNKSSVGLDLRKPAGRDVLLRLVATADIVVENFRPGTLDEWGIGFGRCREVKPDVIVVSISGWGQFGSEASRGGYDPIVQAESGWMALNGVSDGEPIKAPSFLADDLVGLHAAISALAALRHRDQTGEGQHVDVAMLDALLFQSDGFLTLGATGVPLDRWGNETPFLVPSNRYACADGDVYLVIALDKQWRRFAELIGRPEMAEANGFRTNQQRISNRSSVNKMVAEWCAGRTVGDVVGRLDKAGLAVGRVRTFEQVAGDPHILERDMLQTVELSNGASAPIVGPAAKFSRTPTSVRKPAPPAGADTEEVLGSVGIDETARRALREERVI